MNGDGKPDLVVGNHGSVNISILLNSGDGTFGTAVNYPTPVTGTSDAVALGEFNAQLLRA